MYTSRRSSLPSHSRDNIHIPGSAREELVASVPHNQPTQDAFSLLSMDFDEAPPVKTRSSFLDKVLEPKTIEAALCILGWYFFSLSISVYNKWMFGAGLGFTFPVLITAFHQICIFITSGIVLYLFPHLRPPSIRMPWLSYVRQIFPCAVASAGDIGLSNMSFQYVTLSLYTMVKTLSLVFVLLFGLLFKLEKFNWRLVVIVVIMTGSVMMMVSSPSDTPDKGSGSSRFGVILVLSASLVSGIRWSFTQLLLKRNPYTPNPFSTLFYISPAMAVGLILFGLFFEGWSNFVQAPVWEQKGVPTTIGLIIFPGLLAFMNNFCEFRLLKVLQVVTLLVAGIFKELITIIVSTLVFGDKLSAVNVAGLVITFLDILWYNAYRFREVDAQIDVSSDEQQYKPVQSA